MSTREDNFYGTAPLTTQTSSPLLQLEKKRKNIYESESRRLGNSSPEKCLMSVDWTLWIGGRGSTPIRSFWVIFLLKSPKLETFWMFFPILTSRKISTDFVCSIFAEILLNKNLSQSSSNEALFWQINYFNEKWDRIWVNFPRTGKIVKMCIFNFLGALLWPNG